MKFKPRVYTAAQQYDALKNSSLTSSGNGQLGIGKFQFHFYAQPSVISRTYLIKITYEHKKRPKVIVLEPDLVKLADNRRLPHVYNQSPPELCLYLPGGEEWSSNKLISKTIVPWSVLWLYYFENWLTSDKWEGGGRHPLPRCQGQQ